MSIRSRAPEELDDKTREILEKRAERLRLAPQVAADAAVEHHVAVFPVGEETYAIPLSAFRAVVALRRVTPVPLSRPHIVGILRFQGQIITALSMAALLGIKGWRQDPSVLLVVDPGWGRLVAIDCEDVPRPLGLALGAVDDARTREQRAITEVVHDGQIVHLIDLARLLDRRSGGRSGG
ncbi:MAG TPA: chemotaxis protein CheW [Kofleriaceae bacterium]